MDAEVRSDQGEDDISVWSVSAWLKWVVGFDVLIDGRGDGVVDS